MNMYFGKIGRGKPEEELVRKALSSEDDKERMNAVMNYEVDQDELVNIAIKDPCWTVRGEAMVRIDDDNTRRRIASRDTNEIIRKVIGRVRQIERPQQTRGTDDRVR